MDKKAFSEEIEQVIQEGPFDASWDSLMEYRVPVWYKKAKFGIFIHWGIYSVPAFANEWYPRNMYIQGTPEFAHHVETYGPHKEFGYKDFIPYFKAEKFDAKEWVALFKEAGAQYVVPVAEHHDGFQMYHSDLSDWCASKMGPCKNTLGMLSEACEEAGIMHGASSHRIEHWFFLGHGKEFDSDIPQDVDRDSLYWPAMPEGDLQDIFSKPEPSQEFMEDWLLRCCELIKVYQPAIVYFDWWIQHQAMKPYLQKFAAYYYNMAAKRNQEVVINYKHDAFAFGTAVVDIERGQFAEAKPYVWQTDTSVAKNSWCYTEGNQYKTATQLLQDLVDIVSKNGRMMLNVGPKADGTIPEEDAKILKEIGSWMKKNGEAIYETGLWRKSAEGPTEIVEGQFADDEARDYTAEDIRFTVKGRYIYAICLNMKDKDEIIVRSLSESDASHKPNFHGIIKDVTRPDGEKVLNWKRDENGLTIQTTKAVDSKPVVFRIEIE